MTRQRRIDSKPLVYRRAVAVGELQLRPATLRAIRAGRIEKGDPLPAAELAGLLAMKRTPELLPHCHPIPLTGSRVEARLGRTSVIVEGEAEAVYRTGVEMEALTGTAIALLTIWDMVKYLEKQADGSYPTTRIRSLRVVKKEKIDPT
jgi:cyclic pyranopterin phosphate synthase